MPAQVRKKKIEKIYLKLMGKPSFMIDLSTKKDRDIEKLLVQQAAMKTMYK